MQTSPSWTYLILLISLQIAPPLSQSIYCNTAKECVGNTSIHAGQVSVFANGYKSLSGPTTSITASSISCYGSYSCNDISFISSSNIIYCRGSNACGNIDTAQYVQLTKTNAYIYCGGSNSCADSNLRAATALNLSSIYCYGADSCANADIVGVTNIYAYGAYSLYQTTIDSSGITNTGIAMTVTLFGYHSGFGSTIICRADDKCIINCYANGCEMLYIECVGDCTVNKNSNQTIAPITNIADFDSNKLNLFSTLTANNDAICSLHGSLQSSANNVFDDYIQHQYGADIIVTDVNAGPICCRGAWSCTGVNNIQLNTATPHAVVCSGLWSCTDTTISNNHGSIFCEGAWSCWSATILTTIANNVYCFGSRSCQNADITGAGNIYCTGRRACSNSEVRSGGDLNVYLLGETSAVGTDIYCNEGDHCFILCGGSDACRDATQLFCGGTCEIECDLDSGCPDIYATFNPTQAPTPSPTELPTELTLHPTQSPTELTLNPSSSPTKNPTELTLKPSIFPTQSPTLHPTQSPTELTLHPTQNPTRNPSVHTTVLLSEYDRRSSVDYIYWLVGGVLFIVAAIVIAVFVCFGPLTPKKTNEIKPDNEERPRTDQLQMERAKERDYKKVNVKSDSDVLEWNGLNGNDRRSDVVMAEMPPPPEIQSVQQVVEIPPASKWMIETMGGNVNAYANDSDSLSVDDSDNRLYEGNTVGGQIINVNVNHSASFSSETELDQIDCGHVTNKYSYYQ